MLGRIFGGAYFRSSLLSEGILRFKTKTAKNSKGGLLKRSLAGA